MKKTIIALILVIVLLAGILRGETILRKYGTATTVDFELYDSNSPHTFFVSAVSESGDCKIMKDEGGEATVDTNFVDRGQGYSIALSQTEMTAKRIALYIADLSTPKLWMDRYIAIDTYGNASAEHPFDLASATVTLAPSQTFTDTLTLTATEPNFTATANPTTILANIVIGNQDACDIQSHITTNTPTLAGTQTFNNTGTWTGNLAGNVTGSVNGLNDPNITTALVNQTTLKNSIDNNAVTPALVAYGAEKKTDFDPCIGAVVVNQTTLLNSVSNHDTNVMKELSRADANEKSELAKHDANETNRFATNKTQRDAYDLIIKNSEDANGQFVRDVNTVLAGLIQAVSCNVSIDYGLITSSCATALSNYNAAKDPNVAAYLVTVRAAAEANSITTNSKIDNIHVSVDMNGVTVTVNNNDVLNAVDNLHKDINEIRKTSPFHI